MADMRMVLRIFRMRLFDWPRRTVSWLGLMVGLNFALMPTAELIRAAERLNTPLQIAEAYVLAGSDFFACLLTIVGLVIMLSDAPFIDERIAFVGVRVSRRQWMTAHVLYVVAVCALYQLALFLFTAAVCAGRAYLGGIWSGAVWSLAQGKALAPAGLWNVRFRNTALLQAYTPYGLLGITFLLQTLYGAALTLWMFALNLHYRRGAGIAVALCVHQLGMIFLRSSPDYVNPWLSPMVHALSNWHNVFGKSPRYPTLGASAAVLCALALAAVALCAARARRMDYAMPFRNV